MLRSSLATILIILSVFSHQSDVVSCYRILCAFPTISRSHFLVVEALTQGLAEAGHTVTVIGPQGVLEPIDNYTHVEMKMGSAYKNMLQLLNSDPGNVFNVFGAMLTAFDFSVSQITDMLAMPEVKNILASDKYDLVLIEALFGESLLGLGPHFNCPVVVFTSLKAGSFVLDMFKNPLALSYVPNLFASFSPPMNFWQRVQNMINYLLETPLYQMARWKYEKAYNEFFPAPKYPSYHEMRRNVSLLFVAQHFHCDGAQPFFPNIIEVGGIHLSDEKMPMPADLAKWMNESTHGVVYFSLGTIFNITQIPVKQLTGVLEALGKLKQHVIFKTDFDDLPFVPANVRVERWVPQIAVLQHNNTKMFITHGGLGSITEARFYGVPVVLIPVGIDQFSNAMTATKEGWGLIVPFKMLTGETLSEAMQTVLENPKYYENGKQAAELFRDRPLTPKQTAIFWIEYVIRHNGAKFMIPQSVHQNFFQLQSLDVIGFLGTLLVILIICLYTTMRFIVSKIFVRPIHKIKLS